MKRVPILLALVGALVVAGCGDSTGGADEISVETGSLSKPQFIERADGICNDAIKKVRLAFQSWFAKNRASIADQRAELPQVISGSLVPTFEEQIQEVSALGAPAGDEEQVAEILEEMQKVIDEAQADPIRFVGNPTPFAKSTRLGEKYGFTRCGYF